LSGINTIKSGVDVIPRIMMFIKHVAVLQFGIVFPIIMNAFTISKGRNLICIPAYGRGPDTGEWALSLAILLLLRCMVWELNLAAIRLFQSAPVVRINVCYPVPHATSHSFPVRHPTPIPMIDAQLANFVRSFMLM
jgi:hypothetical protein